MAGIKRLEGETDKEYWTRVETIIDSLDCLHTRNGQVIARYPSRYRTVPFAADQLTGILKADYDLDGAKSEYFEGKYAAAN
ncbi:MAG: hypothetical protein IJP89_05025 [Synergistaceae bacterium]|nr:hypothetical protein [Synergistaceae bacterium]MBR0256679.1 hypothetical protein [Synergistaceae bacterium]